MVLSCLRNRLEGFCPPKQKKICAVGWYCSGVNFVRIPIYKENGIKKEKLSVLAVLSNELSFLKVTIMYLLSLDVFLAILSNKLQYYIQL